MRTGPPSSAAITASTVDALQEFTERRRERFVEGFASQCDEILVLADRINERSSRGPVGKLRQLARRLSTHARLIGFFNVSTRATELEHATGNGDMAKVTAEGLIRELHAALASDLKAVLRAPEPSRQDVYAPRLRILTIDDHAMVRRGLRAFLSNGLAGAVFGEAEDGAQAIAMLRAQPWDVALLDISLPGRSGLDWLKDIKREWPRLRVLVVSAHREDEFAVRSLRAGADGYVIKQCAPEELVKAVRKVVDGGRYVSPALAEQLALEARHDHARLPHQALSDREYDVMCQIAMGKTVSEIAADMSLSVKTISTYRTRILQKLELRNNAAIVQYALRNRLVC